MGPYADFIWTAYTIVVVVLTIIGVRSRRLQKRLEVELKGLRELDSPEED